VRAHTHCQRACMHARVRAFEHACVRACMHACLLVCAHAHERVSERTSRFSQMQWVQGVGFRV